MMSTPIVRRSPGSTAHPCICDDGRRLTPYSAASARRYGFNWILATAASSSQPKPGTASTAYLFGRLEMWMREHAPGGCLFVNALAAHPNNEAIRAAVKRHKDEIRTTLGRRAGRPQRANDIFLLHENACRHRWLLATLRRSRSGIWAVAAWPPTLHCAGPFLVGTGSVWRGW